MPERELIRRLLAASPLSEGINSEERRARIVTALLLPIAAVVIGAALLTGVVWPPFYALPLLLLALARWLSLRRRISLAALAATLACAVMPIVLNSLQPDAEDPRLEMMWFVLAILAAGLTLPVRHLIAASGVLLGCGALLLFVESSIPTPVALEALGFLALVSMMTLAHALATARNEELLARQWQRIGSEIARREETETALRESEERLRFSDRQRARFIADSIDAQERERTRIARELHDGLGQAMTNLLVRLGALSEKECCHREAEGLRRITAEILTDLGRISKGLHPTVLDDLGLAAGLRQLAEDVTRIHGLTVDIHLGEISWERLSPHHQITIYRITQEALHNAAKHARARTVSVLLDRRPDGLRLIVEDDGVGFDTAAASGSGTGLGLHSLRERAGLLGGTLSIESSPGAGTTVVVDLPLEGVALA